MSLKSRDTLNNAGVFINNASSSYIGRTTRDTLNAVGSNIDFATIKPDSPIVSSLNEIAQVTGFQTPKIEIVNGWSFVTNTLPYTLPIRFFLFLLFNKNNPIPSFTNGDINWNVVNQTVREIFSNVIIKNNKGEFFNIGGILGSEGGSLATINPGEGYQMNIASTSPINLLTEGNIKYSFLNPQYASNHDFNDSIIKDVAGTYYPLPTVGSYFDKIQSPNFIVPHTDPIGNSYFKVDGWNMVGQIGYGDPSYSVGEFFDEVFNLNDPNNPYTAVSLIEIAKNNSGLFYSPESDFGYNNFTTGPGASGVIFVKFRSFDPHHVALYTNNIVPKGDGPPPIEDFPFTNFYSINNNYLNLNNLFPLKHHSSNQHKTLSLREYRIYHAFEDIRRNNNYVLDITNPSQTPILATNIIIDTSVNNGVIFKPTNIDIRSPYITPSCYLVRYSNDTGIEGSKNINGYIGWTKKPGSDFFPTNLIVHDNYPFKLRFKNSPISGSSISKNISIKSYSTLHENTNNYFVCDLDSDITHHNLRSYYDSHSLIQGNTSGSNITSSYFFVSSSFQEVGEITATNNRSYNSEGILSRGTSIISDPLTLDNPLAQYTGSLLGFYQNPSTSHSFQSADWWLNSSSKVVNIDGDIVGFRDNNLLIDSGGQLPHPFIPSLDYLPDNATSTPSEFPLGTLKIQTSSVFNNFNPVEINSVNITFLTTETENEETFAKMGNFLDIHTPHLGGTSTFEPPFPNTGTNNNLNDPNIFYVVGDKHIEFTDEFDSNISHSVSNLTQKISQSNFNEYYILNVGGVSNSKPTISGSLTFFNPNNSDIWVRYRSNDSFNLKKLNINIDSTFEPRRLEIYGTVNVASTYNEGALNLIQDSTFSSLTTISPKIPLLDLIHPASDVENVILNNNVGLNSMTAQHFTHETDYLGNNKFIPQGRIVLASSADPNIPTTPTITSTNSSRKFDHNVFHNFENTDNYIDFGLNPLNNLTNFSNRYNEIRHNNQIVGYLYESSEPISLDLFNFDMQSSYNIRHYLIQGSNHPDGFNQSDNWINVHESNRVENVPSGSIYLFPNKNGEIPQDYYPEFFQSFTSVSESLGDNFNMGNVKVGTSSISFLYDRYTTSPNSSEDLITKIKFKFTPGASQATKVPRRISISSSKVSQIIFPTFIGENFNPNLTDNDNWTPEGEIDFYGNVLGEDLTFHQGQFVGLINDVPFDRKNPSINTMNFGDAYNSLSGQSKSNRWKRIKIDMDFDHQHVNGFELYSNNSVQSTREKNKRTNLQNITIETAGINANMYGVDIPNSSKSTNEFQYWRIIGLLYKKTTIRTKQYAHKKFGIDSDVLNNGILINPLNQNNYKSIYLKFSNFKIQDNYLAEENNNITIDTNDIVNIIKTHPLSGSLLETAVNSPESIFNFNANNQSIYIFLREIYDNLPSPFANTFNFDAQFLQPIHVIKGRQFKINSIDLFKSPPSIFNLKIGGNNAGSNSTFLTNRGDTSNEISNFHFSSNTSLNSYSVNLDVKSQGFKWRLRQEKIADFLANKVLFETRPSLFSFLNIENVSLDPFGPIPESHNHIWKFIQPEEGYTVYDVPTSRPNNFANENLLINEINPLVTYENPYTGSVSLGGVEEGVNNNLSTFFRNSNIDYMGGLFNFVQKPVIPLNENNQLIFEYNTTDLDKHLPYDILFYDSNNLNVSYQKTSSAILDININYKNPYRIETQLQPDNGKSLIYSISDKLDIDINNLTTTNDTSTNIFVNKALLSESICLPLDINLSIFKFNSDINDVLKQASITFPKNFGAKTVIATTHSGSLLREEEIKQVTTFTNEQLTSDNQEDRTFVVNYVTTPPNAFPSSWGTEQNGAQFNFYFLNFYDDNIFKIETFGGEKFGVVSGQTDWNNTEFKIRLPKDSPDLFDSRPLIDRNRDY